MRIAAMATYLVASTVSLAQECEPSFLTGLGGTPLDIDYDGESMLLAANAGGLFILDAADPQNVSLLGRVPATWQTRGVQRSGDLAYLAEGVDGLRIVDMSDRANPMEIGSIDTLSVAQNVAVQDGFALVADGPGGLHVMDVQDPTAPFERSSLPLYQAFDVIINGTSAYVSGASGQFWVIDFSDPDAPVELGAVADGTPRFGMARTGDLVLTASLFRGLEIFNVSDPANPVLVGDRDVDADAWSVAVVNDTAFLGTDAGLFVIDITVPIIPLVIGHVDPGAAIRGIAIDGDRAYLASGDDGMFIVDISDPTAPTMSMQWDIPNNLKLVRTKNDVAFVVGDGLFGVDTSDPASTEVLSKVSPPGVVRDIVFTETLAVLAADHAGIVIYDITDVTNPVLLSELALLDEALGVAVEGDLCYASEELGRFVVLDIGDPTSPQLIGASDDLDASGQIVIDQEVAYVAAGHLLVFDIKDPTAPALLTSVPIPGNSYGTLEQIGDHVFVATGSGVGIFDVSDPAAAHHVGSAPTRDSVDDLAVVGDRLFACMGEDGIEAFDMSRPGAPRSLGIIPAKTIAMSVDAQGDVLSVADEDAGLLTYDVSSCVTCPGDYNQDGALNVLDFVGFQTGWLAQDPAADCNDDADFTILDFVCFQQLFQAGCP